MRTIRRDDCRNDDLAEVGENERHRAHGGRALQASREQLELRDAAEVERCDSQEGCEDPSAKRRKTSRDVPSG